MSGAEIDRLRADLATMRQAAGFGLPFGRGDIWMSLGVAAAGALSGGWAAFVPWEKWWGTVLPLFALVVAYAVFGRTAGRDKGREPARWQEYRLSLLAIGLFMPVAIGFLLWQEMAGVPRQVTGAAAVLFIGVAAVFVGFIDRTRRYYLVAGICAMAMGIALPLLRPAQVPIAGGICLFAIGTLSALAQMFQLERQVAMSKTTGRVAGESARAE